MAHSEEGAMVCVQSLGIKPRGPNPGGPALGKPRSCFNVNFNSYAHGLRSGTKVPLSLLILFYKKGTAMFLVQIFLQKFLNQKVPHY